MSPNKRVNNLLSHIRVSFISLLGASPVFRGIYCPLQSDDEMEQDVLLIDVLLMVDVLRCSKTIIV